MRTPLLPAGLSLVGFVLIALSACGGRTPGNTEDDKKNDQDVKQNLPAGNIAVTTSASAGLVVAGTEVQVSCAVTLNTDPLPSAVASVAVEGPVEAVAQGENIFNVSATTVGFYTFRCVVIDGDRTITDAEGVQLEVIAAEANTVNTAIQTATHGADGEAQIAAGVAGEVSCTLSDRYGNTVEPLPTSLIPEPYLFTLRTDNTLEIAVPRDGRFTVRGTVVGRYDVACQVQPADSSDIYVDDTPASLRILPGAPGISSTSVSSALITPTQTVDISCAITDEYGNALDDATAAELVPTATVLPGDKAGYQGLVISGEGTLSFSAERAGIYYVMCQVPGVRAGDETPVTVVVEPGLAFSWDVFMPNQDCFWEDRGLPVSAAAYDRWGNAIDKDRYALTVESVPAGATLANDGYVYLTGEGDFDVVLRYGGSKASDAEITPFVANVRVDSTPPVVDFTSPLRGATLMQNGTDVALEGTVTDTVSDIESIIINNEVVSVSGSTVAFTVDRSGEWGLNIFGGTAVDTCGNRRALNQSYMLSPQYYAAALAPEPAARAPSGLIAHMGQVVLDDKNPDPDDLATMIGGVLGEIDLNASVPTYITASPDANNDNRLDQRYVDNWFCSKWVYKTGWALSKPGALTTDAMEITEFTAVDGGARLGLRITNLYFPIRVRGAVYLNCASLSGTISGDVRASQISLTATLSISRSGEVSQVSICPTCVNVSFSGLAANINTNPALGFIDSYVDSAASAALAIAKDSISKSLANSVRQALPGTIESFLNNFDMATSFQIPPPLDMTLSISSVLDHVLFSGPPGSGFGELGFATQVYPSAKGETIASGAFGAIRETMTDNRPSFAAGRDFGVGLRDDLFNQIFWALWYGGGLSLSSADVAALVGTDSGLVDFQLEALLPPVMMPGDGPGGIRLGIGDMYISASIDLAQVMGSNAPPNPLTIGAYLSTIMSGNLDVDPTLNELVMSLDSNPEIFVQVVELDDAGYQAVMTDILSNLLAVVLPEMLGSAVGSFPIPEIDMSSFGSGYSTLSLDAAEFERANVNYIRLQGNLAIQ